MAQKRMFDNAIINTDKFMDMPLSSKALYFLLGMEADDYGFVSPRRVMKLHNATEDDLKILIAKQYVIYFKTSGVVVITDWKKNNWLDKRRVKQTEFTEELKMLETFENKYILKGAKPVLSECLASIEENSIEESSIEEYIEPKKNEVLTKVDVMFNDFWNEYPNKKAKQVAYKSFMKLKPDEKLFNELMDKLQMFKKTKDWQKEEGKYIPYPSTWINQKRWEDELTEKDFKKVTTKDLDIDISDF